MDLRKVGGTEWRSRLASGQPDPTHKTMSKEPSKAILQDIKDIHQSDAIEQMLHVKREKHERKFLTS